MSIITPALIKLKQSHIHSLSQNALNRLAANESALEKK